MSPDFERLIGRAVTDKEFRDAVLADPEQAARDAGLQLDSKELDQIKENVSRINADAEIKKQVDEQFAANSVAFW